MTTIGEAVIVVRADGSGVQSDVADAASPSRMGSIGKGAGKALGLGIVGAAGLAVGGLTAAVFKAMDGEAVTDKLAAQLGANEKESERLGGIAGRLYANAYGESMADVAAGVGAVKTALSGDFGAGGLEKATAQAMDYATIFDIDVVDAANAAGVAVKSGLAKDSTEAFDLMTRASQKVGPALAQDVLDASGEYGGFFKQLGFDGPSAFGALVKGADKGVIGIDKAGDAVKEFTLLATEIDNPAYAKLGLDAGKMANDILAGGDKAKGATDKIVQGLLDIKDPAQQAQAAVELFGTPLEDLGKGDLRDFLKGMQDGKKGLGEFKGAADDAGKTLNDNAKTNFESFKRQVIGTFVDTVGGVVLPKLSQFATFLQANIGPALQRVGPIVEQVRGFFMNLVGGTGGLQTKIGELRSTFMSVFANVKTIVADAVSIVKSLWATFGSTIVSFTRSYFTNAMQIIRGVFNVIAGIFKTVSALLKGDWRGVWEGIKQIVKGAAGVITGVVKQFWNLISSIFKASGQALKAAMSAVWSGIKTGISNAFNGYKSLVSKGADNIVSEIKSIPGKIKQLGGDMLGAGREIIGKLFEGIRSAASGAGGLVSDIASGIKSAINSALGLPFHIEMPGPIPGSFTIPAFARGGTSAGGMALVGEEGPELVNLPRGSYVNTAQQSARMARSMGSAPTPQGRGGSLRIVEGTLDISPSGKAFIRGLAVEEIEASNGFAAVMAGMK